MPHDPEEAALRMLSARARALKSARTLIPDDVPSKALLDQALEESSAILADAVEVARHPAHAEAD